VLIVEICSHIGSEKDGIDLLFLAHFFNIKKKKIFDCLKGI